MLALFSCSPFPFFPSVLLQLIIFESLLINRINVLSDALCHALVPLSCSQFLDRTVLFPTLALTVVGVDGVNIDGGTFGLGGPWRAGPIIYWVEGCQAIHSEITP